MHIESDCMRRAVHRGRFDELVLVLIEPTNGRHYDGTGGEEAIYVFMDFDINCACGLDGT